MPEGECYSCGNWPEDECPKSERPCGHHCNHYDDGDCHWCGAKLEVEDAEG